MVTLLYTQSCLGFIQPRGERLSALKTQHYPDSPRPCKRERERDYNIYDEKEREKRTRKGRGSDSILTGVTDVERSVCVSVCVCVCGCVLLSVSYSTPLVVNKKVTNNRIG